MARRAACGLVVALALALAACQATPTVAVPAPNVAATVQPTPLPSPSPAPPTATRVATALPAPTLTQPLPTSTPSWTSTATALPSPSPTPTATPVPFVLPPILTSRAISLTGWLPITVDSAARLHEVDQLNFSAALRPFSTATGQVVMPDAAAWLSGFTGYVAFVAGASPVWSWNVLTGRAVSFTTSGLEDIAGHDVLSLAFDPGTYPAIGAGLDNGNVILWDAASGDVVRLFEHGAAVQALAFSQDGNSLATGGIDHAIQIWNVYNGSLEGTLSGQNAEIRALAFNPAGDHLAATAADGSLHVWNLVTRQVEQTFTLNADGGAFLSYSADGGTLWSAESSGRMASWDLVNEAARPPLDIGAEATAWAINADGRLLAAASAATIGVWDFASGQRLVTLEGHSDPISGLAFSPDSLLLISGSRDGTLRAWGIEK